MVFDPALKDQILGIARVIVPAIFVAAASFKWIAGDQATILAQNTVDAIAAIVTLIFAIWAFVRNRQANQIAKVAKLEAVKQIVVDNKELADVELAEHPKVVSQ